MKIGDKQVETVLKKCNFGTKLIFSILLILGEIFGVVMGCTPGPKSTFLPSGKFRAHAANRPSAGNVLN